MLLHDSFCRSPRMRKFLRFVVGEALGGNAHRLKEYVIAIEVFDRDVTFGPQTNASVRVEASRMRHRLQEYFLGPGRDDPVHIALPAGSYVPEFVDSAAIAGTDVPLALPDKPSIAVLPFSVLGGDADQEYLADGIAEDLITALSRIRWLFVIARTSAFAFKGGTPDVRQVGAALGVRYVVEGSVRKSVDRIRVSAQLIDATTGHHVWAQKYDRELVDIFDLQDEISETIAAAIEPEIGEVERERARRKPPGSLDAWACYQRGLWHIYRFVKGDNAKAQDLLCRAVELDPNFAAAFAALGYSHFLDITLAFTKSRSESAALSLRHAGKAVDLDDKDATAHHALGRALYVMGDGTASIAELRKAIALNPSFALAHFGLGMTLSNLAEDPEQALEAYRMAARLSPHDPAVALSEHESSLALLMLDREREALEYARRAAGRPNVHFWTHVNLAAILGRLGKIEEARAALDKVFEIRPDFSADLIEASWEGGYAHRKLKDKELDGLRKAGLRVPAATDRPSS